MHEPPSISPAADHSSAQTRLVWLAIISLAVAGFVAYANSLEAPFTFDDIAAIAQNPSIRLWSTAFRPSPESAGAVGRPLVNLSLAFNYAIGGLDVIGYHVFNLTVHILAGFTLFGVLRHTFMTALVRKQLGSAALPLAFFITLLWLVHPLQTETVVCIIQRDELLVGLLYLSSLYSFIRSTESPAPCRWQTASAITCLLGMATKEVMVTAPLVVLLYDRTFVSGTFTAACRLRWRFYLVLASSWLFLGWMVSLSGQRSGTAGWGLGVSSWTYLLTQCEAITTYLRLCFWPHPLIVDYGEHLVANLLVVLPQALIIVSLLTVAAWAVIRRPAWGFLGAFFFVVLAPSSSVLPLVTQTIAEHRMYLSLAVVVVSIALLSHQLLSNHWWKLLLPAAVALAVVTVVRNNDYRSELSLLTATVKARPDNPRAHQDLGVILASEGRKLEAMSEYKAALALQPTSPNSHYNLANLLFEQGQVDEAVEHFFAALKSDPALIEAHYNLANILVQKQRPAEAIDHYSEVLRLLPARIDARINLANTLASTNRLNEAVFQYREALHYGAEDANTHYNLGHTLLRLGLAADAAEEFRKVLRLQPYDEGATRGLARAEQMRSGL